MTGQPLYPPPAQGAYAPPPAAAAVDTAGLSELAALAVPLGKAPAGTRLSRAQRKAEKEQIKQARRQNGQEQRRLAAEDRERRRQAGRYKTVSSRVRELDKEGAKSARAQRRRRSGAADTAGLIGYDAMFADGLCELEYDAKDGWGLYSETLEIDDMSYQTLREDGQRAVFAAMGQLYDYFGPSVAVQMSVVKTRIPEAEIGSRAFFDAARQDSEAKRGFAALYNGILNKKMSEGVSNLVTKRYMTYSVGAPDADRARSELASVRSGVMSNLQNIVKGGGPAARRLDGKERLAALNALLNPGRPLYFDYARDISPASPMTTKDFIAPQVLDDKPDGSASGCYFRIGESYGQVLWLRGFGTELYDSAFSDFINLPMPLCLTWHVQNIEMGKAFNMARGQVAMIDSEVIALQMKANRKGYSANVAVPMALRHNASEAEGVVDKMQSNNQRMFSYTGLLYITADSQEELSERVKQAVRVAMRNSIELCEVYYQQKEALNSVLPLGNCHLDVSRTMLTAELAAMVPFAAVDMMEEGGTYYGQSKESGNLILHNRRRASSPICFISGITGYGKSYFVKNEMQGNILSHPGEKVYIFDRAGEYAEMARANGGTDVVFGVGTEVFMNPLAFDLAGQKTRSQLVAEKIDAVITQAAASAAEHGRALDDCERSILSRCVEQSYELAEGRLAGSMPTLGDLHKLLTSQPEHQARELALRYEMHIDGVMGFFNRQSNIDFSKDVINFNFRQLPESMVVFAFIYACEVMRNRMYHNHATGVRTSIYIEEVKSVFKYAPVLEYFARFANEGRKFGLLLTCMTQSAQAMLENPHTRDLINNAGMLVLLRQSALDRQLWTELLGLSEREAQYIDESCQPGEGLLIAGKKRIPFRGDFPKGNALYELFDTSPDSAPAAGRP
jgi:hypothetical protein